jgi:protein disulfide-isomerase
LAETVNAQEVVRWQPSLEAAKQVAGQSNQLVLIHFWGPYCPYCRKMEQEVLGQPSIAAMLRASYVPVKLNTEYFPSVAKEYGVTKLPTEVIITPDGKMLHKVEGMPRAPDYLAQLNQIAAANAQRAQPPVVAQMSANPANNNPPPSAATAPAGDGRYADYYRQRGVYTAQPAAAVPSAPAQNTVPQGPVGGDPYARIAAVPPGPAGAQMPAINRETPVSTTPNVPMGPAQVQPGPSYGNVVGPVTPGVPSTPPANPARDFGANVSDKSPARRSIALPAGSPPLCLEGFCPVQLVDNHRWVPGDSRWGAVHQGRTYLFASQEEQRRFLNGNADAYAPVMSGMDVVLAVERQEQVPGTLQHGGYFAKHVYLFASEETLEKFSQRPEYYLQALRAAANPPYQR